MIQSIAIICGTITPILLVVWIGFLQRKCNRLSEQNTKCIENINSLLYNQNVLVLSLKELHKQIDSNERKNQKVQKEVKRQIRVFPNGGDGKAKGTQPVRPH